MVVFGVSKFNYALTAKSLVSLGIYEDTRSLYESLRKRAIKVGYHRFIQDKTPSKKLINEFLLKYYIIFDDYKLYVNNVVFGFINIYDVKNLLSLYKGDFKIISFGKFLIELEYAIAVIINRRNNRMGKNCDFEKTLRELNIRIEEMVKRAEYGQNILNREVIEYDLTIESKTIWIYTNLNNLRCNRDNHNIVPKMATVKIVGSDNTCNLPIDHCLTCDDYFIGRQSLKIAQKQYGILFIKSHLCSPDQCEGISWEEFNDSQSELYSYGYNVIDGFYTTEERHIILKELLDANIMNKFSIRRDLNSNLKRSENRHDRINAVYLWREDLKFVDNYGADEFIGVGKLDRK